MELHTFFFWESDHWSGGRYASADAIVHVNVTFAEWRSIHGGDFFGTLPIEYAPCRTGFFPYRSADGIIYGVKLSPDDQYV
jgi:hypothetical protein